MKHSSGAKTKYLKDYSKPSQRENSDHYILHVGTNDLCLDRSPELITKSVIDLALTSNETMSAYPVLSYVTIVTL